MTVTVLGHPPDTLSVYETPDHEQLARMILALDWYARPAGELAERAGLSGRPQAIAGLLRRLKTAGLADYDDGLPGLWWTTGAAALAATVLREQRAEARA